MLQVCIRALSRHKRKEEKMSKRKKDGRRKKTAKQAERRRRAQLQKPWYEKIRKDMPPAERVENPEKGGVYDRPKWRKEAYREGT